MNPRDVDEVRALFDDAESEADPAPKLEALKEALALADEIVNCAEVPEGSKVMARNIRRSHLRRLIQQLIRLRDLEVNAWSGYIRFLLLDRQAEVSSILEENPSLNEGYKAVANLVGHG
jgi:hypothetical protein